MELPKEYPEIWKKIENKEIPQKDIDETLLKFVEKQIKEAREGKRKDMDVGDAFGVGIQHAMAGKGYKFSEEVEDFLYELGEYKVYIGQPEFKSLEEVEKELKRISKKLGIGLDL